MSKAQISMWEEKIVDSFAGGGGASTGIELATGRVVDVAINHDPDAILMHKTNHPHTTHYQASVWDVDPLEVTGGSPVGLLWASPDCKHFSKAKGGKPVDKNIRGLAWIVLRWAGTVRPRVIILENVEEFQTWGPVRRGRPVKSKTGQTFRRFVDQLEALGYAVEWRELVAADYGALLVIVTKYCDDRSFFEFHLFDPFTDLTKSLDLQVDPPVIVLLTAIIFAVSDLENSKLAAVLAIEEADRRCAVISFGHNGI